jgi:DNA-binding FadR family transcriptional regulator
MSPKQTQTRRDRIPPDQFTPIETGSAVDAVVDQIVDQIRSGKLPEEALLPGERQLASAFGVSRRTVRSAIETLQDAGVVKVSPGPAGGIRVSSVWIPDSLGRARGATTPGEVFKVLESRRVVEPRVAQLAALRSTDDDIAVMQNTIDLQYANREDRWKVNEGNTIFHRQLWRAAANPELEAAMRLIYRRLSGVFFDALVQDDTSDAPDAAIVLHEETLQAIASGNAEATAEVMDRHLAYLERRCEAAFGRARIPDLPDFLLSR